jgi:cytidylate kinase
MIITVSGKPCTGKSTMAEIFCKKYNFDRIYGGAIFKEEAKKLGLNVKELALSQQYFDID